MQNPQPSKARPTRRQRTVASVCIAALTAGQSGIAAADSLPSPAGIAEIVVTATKRETTLQTTPVAISVVSGRMLDEAGARGFDDYYRQVPGLEVVDNGAGRKRYIIRGVNGQQASMMAATVAQYVDEVPITNNFDLQPDPRLVDIERIEVLRGPQGTLFGARAMSGAIRTITRKPVFGRVEGSATVGLSGTHDGGANERAEAVLSLPLASTAAVRFNGFYSHDEGYVDNVFTGGTFDFSGLPLPPGVPTPPPVTLPSAAEKNYSDVTYYGGRMALRWAANDRLVIDLTGLGQHGKVGGPPQYDPALTGNGSFKISAFGSRGNSDTLLIGTGTVTYDFDAAQLTAVGAYSYRDNQVLDNTPRSATLENGESRNSGGVTKGRTVEVRLASKGGGALQWLVGGYYFNQDQNALATMAIGFGGVTVSSIFSNGVAKEYAGFGEATYEIIEHLKLTAGLRYSDTVTALNQIFYIPPPGAPFAPGGTNPNPPRFAETNVSLKFSASYDFSKDLFTYFTAAQGDRPGGFNASAVPGFTAVPPGYNHDSLWNYEVGMKSTFLDRRLSVDGAVYRIDWSNMQAESFVNAPIGNRLISYVTNASSARIIGLEIEAASKLTERLSLDVSFNHLFESELTEDAPVNPVGFKPRAGDRLPYSAKTAFNVGADYRRPLTDAISGFVHVDWSYTSGRTTGFRPLLENGQPNDSYNVFAGYHLVGLRVGASSGPWRATVYVDNIADARPVLQQTNATGSGFVGRVTTRPRTIGLTLSATY